VVRYLLARDGDPARRDAEGRAAVDLAAGLQNITLVRLLDQEGRYREQLERFVPPPGSPFIGRWMNRGKDFEQMRLRLLADGTGELRIGFGLIESLHWTVGTQFDGELYLHTGQGTRAIPFRYEFSTNLLVVEREGGEPAALERVYEDGVAVDAGGEMGPVWQALRAWREAGYPEEGPRVSGLGLELLPHELFLETRITHLDISRNRLELIPEEIERLHRVRVLNASANRLWVLPDGMTRLRGLERLELADNRLTFLPYDLSGWSGVGYVDLSKNRLRELPEAVGRLEGLREIVLRDNRLIGLPGGVGAWRRLVRADLRFNALRDLPQAFSRLERLEVLLLGGNHFEEFPLEITELRNLRQLSLRNNRLRELPSALERMQRLEVLDVSYNRLRGLPPQLQRMRGLKAVDLRGNPGIVAEEIAALKRALPQLVVAWDEELERPVPRAEPVEPPPPPVEVVIQPR